MSLFKRLSKLWMVSLVLLLLLCSFGVLGANNETETTDGGDSKPTKTEETDSKTAKATSSSKPRIPSNAARGMITMLEPPVAQNFIAGWAIGTVARMKWKYDNNVKIKPENVSIIAIRQDGGITVTYNIGSELPNDVFEYEWDTANYTKDPSNPPLVESENYKLYIYDTARSYLIGAPAGGLNPFSRPFRLYKGSDGVSNICLKCLSAASHTQPTAALITISLLLISQIIFLVAL